MNILKRKTPQNIRFGEQKPKYYFHIRAFAVLLGVFFLLGVYFNWQSILEKMMISRLVHLHLLDKIPLRLMMILKKAY